MNYLAHIFLSSSPQEQVGNFIGDFVKGNRFEDYPPEVRKGILHHRAIDEFTDTHPVVLQAKALLREPFGRYAGIVLDLYFDYFLANRFSDYSKIKLKTFARKFYWTLWRNRRILPARVRGFMWHFISTNRLCQYATYEGLHTSLSIMARYKSFPVDPGKAIAFLQKHEAELGDYFSLFFNELVAFSNNKIS